MPGRTELSAAALSQLLIHAETGCRHSALQAAQVLDRPAELPELDEPTRCLCERANFRLSNSPLPEVPNACHA